MNGVLAMLYGVILGFKGSFVGWDVSGFILTDVLLDFAAGTAATFESLGCFTPRFPKFMMLLALSLALAPLGHT